MSDALAIADVEQQIGFRDNEHKSQYRGRKNSGFGWTVPSNLSHAKVAREKTPVAEAAPAVPTIAKPRPESSSGDVVLIKGNTRFFEPFRIVENYEALCEALSERVEDLQATRLGIDAAGRFADGHASTLLCKPQIKGYGPTSLTRMLEATGLVLVLAIDDEKFAKVKDRLILRERQLRPVVHKQPAPQ
jgi:hypothetical protein